MKFDTPIVRDAGDQYVIVYFGDTLDVRLNLLVHAVAARLRAADIDGLQELVIHFASILVKYDSRRTARDKLVSDMRPHFASTPNSENSTLDSRLVTLPVMFFDPWTHECVEDYRRQHSDKIDDIEVLLEANNLPDRNALKTACIANEYWVASVGFRPGLPMCLPLDPRYRLYAPKYATPRTWTPPGSLGIGGAGLSIYASRSAGGYQIFGRTPIPVWSLALHSEETFGCLFRPGDRIRLTEINEDAFHEIEHALAAGSYQPDIQPGEFVPAQYEAWLDTLETRST